MTDKEIEKLCDEFYKDYQSPPYAHEKGAWRQGFKACINLKKDNIFTSEDMKNMLEAGLDWWGRERDNDLNNSEDFFNRYINSIKK